MTPITANWVGYSPGTPHNALFVVWAGARFWVAQRFQRCVYTATKLDGFSRWRTPSIPNQPRSGARMQPTAQAVG
jgi:hypothetical protein